MTIKELKTTNKVITIIYGSIFGLLLFSSTDDADVLFGIIFFLPLLITTMTTWKSLKDY